MTKYQQIKKDGRTNIKRSSPLTPNQEEQINLSTIKRSGSDRVSMSSSQIMYLQRTIGNAAVLRLLAEQEIDDARQGKAENQKRSTDNVGIQWNHQRDKVSSTDENKVANTDVSEQAEQGIQRRIYLNQDQADLTELYSEIPYGKRRVVVANWHWADLEHKFVGEDKEEAKGKLITAVDKVAEQTSEAPALFQKANLMFVTKASGREPTLYFKQGNESGRLRQQHPSGPTFAQESNKTDYFFTSEDAARQFSSYARNVHKKQAKGGKTKIGIRSFKKHFDITTVPATGMFHFELTGSVDAIRKRHLSGGTVDVNLDVYTPEKIQAIYQSITGQTT